MSANKLSVKNIHNLNLPIPKNDLPSPPQSLTSPLLSNSSPMSPMYATHKSRHGGSNPGSNSSSLPQNIVLPKLPSTPLTRNSSLQLKNSNETLTKRSPTNEFTTLTYLDLSTNFSALDAIASTGGLPKWIRTCVNLEYLIAEDVGLVGIDDWMSESLKKLKVLRLANNNITTWPGHLAKLLPYNNLKVIDLEGNPCFRAFCERCPRFATEYAIAAGYITGCKKTNAASVSTPPAIATSAASIISVARPSPSPSKSSFSQSVKSQKKKKSSFFFSSSKSKKKKEEAAAAPPVLPPPLIRAQSMISTISSGSSVFAVPSSPATSTHPSSSPSTPTSLNFTQTYEDDEDSSDDEMLTSLAPVVRLSMKPTHHHTLSSAQSISESVYSQESLSPDKWAQKRIEGTELEKTKVLLNLLRDICELCISREIVPFQKQRVSYVSAGSQFRFPYSKGGHSRTNSVDLLEQYLEIGASVSTLKLIPPPDSTLVTSLLMKIVCAEKEYVQKLHDLITTYVNSKKRPAKTAKLFTHIPELHQLHLNTMIHSLQNCLDAYKTGNDDKLEKLANLFNSHMEDFRVYVAYEMGVEESLRLVNFWKRVAAIEANQPSMQYGAAIPGLVAARHPDAYITEWIQKCAKAGPGKEPLSEYLQSPLSHRELYRYLLRKLAPVSEAMKQVHEQFEEICNEISTKKPKAAQERRMQEFDQIYNLKSSLPDNPDRRYIGDVVILLKSEIRLDSPSKTHKPDTIQYIHDEEHTRSKPVPKVVNKMVHKAKYILPLYRLIVCSDLVVLTDEDKKTVLKVLDRKSIIVSLPWKYPVRNNSADEGDSLDDSFESVSIAEANDPPSKIGTNGAVRVMFRDEPVLWYCTMRAHTGPQTPEIKEPRVKMVNLFKLE